jgi:predicted protein tyrosine phosphatase
MIKRNQLGVIFNAFQGKHKKVLTVCSAGCLRSPTAAHILSGHPWNFNTRCAGTSAEYAIVPVTEALIVWADVILVMDEFQQLHINTMQNKLATEYEAFEYKQVINLDIPDNYEYRDPRLLKIMTEKFEELFPEDEE